MMNAQQANRKTSLVETLWHTTKGAISTNTNGEVEIRQKLFENDLVDFVENQSYPLAA